METVSQSGDLKNGNMIDVLVRKLPEKVAQDWLNTSRRSRSDLFLILSYSQYQEGATSIMVKIVKNQTKFYSSPW